MIVNEIPQLKKGSCIETSTKKEKKGKKYFIQSKTDLPWKTKISIQLTGRLKWKNTLWQIKKKSHRETMSETARIKLRLIIYKMLIRANIHQNHGILGDTMLSPVLGAKPIILNKWEGLGKNISCLHKCRNKYTQREKFRSDCKWYFFIKG